MASTMVQVLASSPSSGDPGTLDQEDATSVRGASVRRERSMKFREFGLYASKVSTRPNNSKPTTTPVPASHRQVHGPGLGQGHELPSPVEEDFAYSTSPFFEPTTSQYDLAPQISPLSFASLSPRWDSLANSTTIIYDPTVSATPSEVDGQRPSTAGALPASSPADSLSSESRDEFPLPMINTSPMSKMTSIESRQVHGDPMMTENFSRPRKPSLKQTYPESLRHRAANANANAHADPSHADNSRLWPRERGGSISSNVSTSTFHSLPVRPSQDRDLYASNSMRGRSRQGNLPLSRPPLAYSRTESNGPLARDPLPRMASMPSEELRSSYRSQLSSSTAQGTLATERSSVATKSSSITSISGYGAADEGFTVDDVMGMYANGFRDDSPAPIDPNRKHAREQDQELDNGNDNDNDHENDNEDGDSRPPTSHSERFRRKSAMLEAMSDSLLAPKAKDTIVRDSTAIFESPNMPYVEDAGSRHDSGKIIEEDDEEDFPVRGPQRQQTDKTFASENTDKTRDIYGFRKENQYVSEEQYDTWYGGYDEYMSRRRKKWTAFLKESGLMTDNPNRFPQRSAKTKRFVRKGIPPEWRGAAWFYYAGGPAIVAKHAGVYDSLVQQKAKEVDDEAIERDLHRTFPDNIKFRSAKSSSAPNTETAERSSQSVAQGNTPRPGETPIISSLRRVLHAFSIYNPRIGYCQSLNFLAGLLLLFVETEEHAFWLLNIITRVYLPGTHEMNLEGANVDLGVLMAALRDAMPAVWAKIGGELDGTESVKPKRRGRKAELAARLPPITLCMTAWFMSCFIGTLPIETTLRVWDVFFYEGSKTLFRIALAIFKIGESEIRSVGDPMEIFQVVQTIPRRLVDANGLMEACFRRRNGFGHLSQETIEQRRKERRDGVKLERERTATGLTATGDEGEVRRKGTLFGRRKERAQTNKVGEVM